MIVQPVDTNYVAQVWPLVEKYLESALKEGGEKDSWSGCYNIHHIRSFLSNGSWLLFVATDEEGKIQGAATVAFSNYPMARVGFITLTGGQFIVNKEVLNKLFSLLKQLGATKVQAYCRESMVRLLGRNGFKPITTLVEVDI